MYREKSFATTSKWPLTSALQRRLPYRREAQDADALPHQPHPPFTKPGPQTLLFPRGQVTQYNPILRSRPYPPPRPPQLREVGPHPPTPVPPRPGCRSGGRAPPPHRCAESRGLALPGCGPRRSVSSRSLEAFSARWLPGCVPAPHCLPRRPQVGGAHPGQRSRTWAACAEIGPGARSVPEGGEFPGTPAAPHAAVLGTLHTIPVTCGCGAH